MNAVIAPLYAEYTARVRQAYGNDASEFLRYYPVGSDADVPEAAKTAAREGGVLRTARNWAMAQAKWNTSATYVYNLARVHPFNPDAPTADRAAWARQSSGDIHTVP